VPHIPKSIVVIGGSAGAIEAVSAIIKTIPNDVDAAFFLVIHINPSVPSLLPTVLGRRTALKVQHAVDAAPIERGVFYVAPPDRHMIFLRGELRLGRGARENGFRPAVDPLMRTAATEFGPAVIGIIVSGNLDDGTAGLLEIKKRGGTAMVQHLDEALYSGMPASAVQEIPDVDYVLPAGAIGERLLALVRSTRLQSVSAATNGEPDIAMGGDAPVAKDERETGRLANVACPDCGGTLWERADGQLISYRCRVGHAFSDEALLGAQTEALEKALWTALRALEELSEQAGRISGRMDKRGHPKLAARFAQQKEDADRRAQVLREVLAVNQDNSSMAQDPS
jgi:two-component system, chemotaxis family, protein-glutamate methylesterase/glutaminase